MASRVFFVTFPVAQPRGWFAGFIALALSVQINAQQQTPPPPATAQASDEETTYFELRRSKDRLTQQVAERYFNLVKLQEWSDTTGRFKTMAKYLAHDPNLQWVKLSAIKGSGATRAAKEVTVPVAKLSKTCQSRVKQIATLQKKLDELAAAAKESKEPGQQEPGGFPEGDRGTPMVDERGAEPRGLDQAGIDQAGGATPAPAEFNGGPALAPGSAPTGPVEGESDPDPLGFSELPPAPATGPNAGALQLGAEESRVAIVPSSNQPSPGGPEGPAGDVDPSQWSKSYAAFHANFAVDSATGEVNWNNLNALRTMGEAAATGQEAPAERLEEVRWEAVFRRMQPAEGYVLILLDAPQLPPPLQIEFRLDQAQRATAAERPQFSPGDRVSFSGRLAMTGPTSIVVHVRDPKLVQAAAPTQNR